MGTKTGVLNEFGYVTVACAANSQRCLVRHDTFRGRVDEHRHINVVEESELHELLLPPEELDRPAVTQLESFLDVDEFFRRYDHGDYSPPEVLKDPAAY